MSNQKPGDTQGRRGVVMKAHRVSVQPLFMNFIFPFSQTGCPGLLANAGDDSHSTTADSMAEQLENFPGLFRPTCRSPLQPLLPLPCLGQPMVKPARPCKQ